MAQSFKLYPPILGSTIPPFCSDYVEGLFLRVPFTMNSFISLNQVGGMRLHIMKASNNLDLGYVDTNNFTADTVIFDLADIKSALMVGEYYKIQIAYLSGDNEVGYYSTVALTKYTIMPTVMISNLSEFDTNYNPYYITGVFKSTGDPSEKSYEYKFTIYDEDLNVIETSDWQIHDHSLDTEPDESTDNYMIKYELERGTIYRLQYSVITNTGLTINSIYYYMTGSAAIQSNLDAHLTFETDFEEGTIKLYLVPNGNDSTIQYSGRYLISRTSVLEKFKVWVPIARIVLNGQLPTEPIYVDYTVTHGDKYEYSIQQYNDYNVYSERDKAYVWIKTYDTSHVDSRTGLYPLVDVKEYMVSPHFEDMFLYDGQRQLKLRFNPKVSSFKTTIKDSKKETLGGKYPVFFRNGNIEYKEFSISTLLSYLTDMSENFMALSELQMPIEETVSVTKTGETYMLKQAIIERSSTNLTDDNFLMERRFKLAALDWLNNGKPKLFRSPAEGNYIVRLMNASLSPNDQLSRMVHTVNCTAVEIDECTSAKLREYNILPIIENKFVYARQTVNINFRTYMKSIAQIITGNTSNIQSYTIPNDATLRATVLDVFSSIDFAQGQKIYKVTFTDCDPYQMFELNGHKQIVGGTGTWSHDFSAEPVMSLHIPNEVYKMGADDSNNWHNVKITMRGSLQLEIDKPVTSNFDDIARIQLYDRWRFIRANYTSGNHMTVIKKLYYNSAYQTDLKESLKKIYKIRFWIPAGKVWLMANSNITASETALENYLTSEGSHTYYAVNVNPADLGRNVSVQTYETRTGSAKNSSDVLIDGAVYRAVGTNKTYQWDGEDFISLPPRENASTINGVSYNLLPTEVRIDNVVYDLAYGIDNMLELTSPTIPTTVQCGSLVCGLYVFQTVYADYAFELTSNNDISADNIAIKQAHDALNARWMAYEANQLYFIAVADKDFYSSKYLDTNKCYQNILTLKEVSDISYGLLNYIYGEKHDTQSENDADPTVDVTKVIRFPTVSSWVQAMTTDDSDLMSFYVWQDHRFHKLSRAERANFEGQLVFIPYYSVLAVRRITGNWTDATSGFPAPCKHNVTIDDLRSALAAYYTLIQEHLREGTQELIINAS